jgi:hypothetical protein
MRALVLAALVLIAASMSARAYTLTVAFMDSEGRTCNAEIVIDDGTGHATTASGTDYEGREYTFALQAYSATEFMACGSTMRSYSSGGYWYNVSPSQEGTICSIGRSGGPGYSADVYVYRFSAPDSEKDGVVKATPEHN